MLKIYIVSKNIRQAGYHAHRLQIPEGMWVYVYNPHQLIGLRPDTPIIFVGHWNENTQINEILREINILRCKIPVVERKETWQTKLQKFLKRFKITNLLK